MPEKITIEEAIKRLKTPTFVKRFQLGKGDLQAIQLAIESLERLKFLRDNHVPMAREEIEEFINIPLPSETEA